MLGFVFFLFWWLVSYTLVGFVHRPRKGCQPLQTKSGEGEVDASESPN